MTSFKISLIGGVVLFTIACQLFTPNPRTFEHPAFSFTIPTGWQTMEELWNQPQKPGQDYYKLGLEEIIMVTSAHVQADGPYSVYFAVASSPLTGGTDLETRFHQTYDPLIPELRDVSQKTFDNGSLSGLEITYQRPWGEPWWQFRDIWLENDAVIYVLSFHGSPNDFEKYQDDFDLILQSFSFK